MSWNIGSAALMVGVGWLYFAYGLSLWWAVPAVLVALATWAYPGFSSERQKLFESQTRYYEARAEYYRYLLAKEGRTIS